MLGMQEVEDGTTQTNLETLIGIVKDIEDLPMCSKTMGEIVFNIKNTMSDQHIAEKRFNVLLQEYREKVIPQVQE